MNALELFDIVLPKLQNPPQEALLPAINAVSQFVAKQLRMRQLAMDKVVGQTTVSAGNAIVVLPAASRGLIDNPWLEGEVLPLLPAGGYEKRLYAGQTGQPRYYANMSQSIVLYPTPDEVYTLHFEYYTDPEEVSSTADELPYNGQFDFLYVEAVTLVMQLGRTALVSPELALLVAQAVAEMAIIDEQLQANEINGL